MVHCHCAVCIMSAVDDLFRVKFLSTVLVNLKFAYIICEHNARLVHLGVIKCLKLLSSRTRSLFLRFCPDS